MRKSGGRGKIPPITKSSILIKFRYFPSHRYFVNLKASNVLLFSRPGGSVGVKLSDYFCHEVRSKDDLASVLAENFHQVPEFAEWIQLAGPLGFNQWNIFDAEMFVAGKRIFFGH